MIKEFYLEHKTINMSIEEFLAYNRNELTLAEIYERKEIEKLANKIVENKKLNNFIVFSLANALILYDNALAAADMTKINNLGSNLLSIVQGAGYWFCLILAIKEVIGALVARNTKSIGSIIAKYTIAFGSFYGLPWIFELIKDILS